MTIASNTFLTYSAAGIREDLSDMIYNVAPTETPLLSKIDSTTSKGRLHQWQTDTLASASASNSHIEGDDGEAASAATATVQLTNRCQIQKKVFTVSDTMEAVDKAGRDSELSYQAVKRALELKTDMNTTLYLNQAKVTGGATTAPKMATLGAWIATNDDFGGSGSSPSPVDGTAARNNGTSRSLTESILRTVVRLTYTSGGNPDTLFVTPAHMDSIASTFTGFATHTVDRKDATLYASIDLYRSNYGTFDIVPDRHISDYGSSQYPAFLLQTDMWAAAYLRPMFMEGRAKTGDAHKVAIVTEWTIECRNEKASGGAFDLA